MQLKIFINDVLYKTVTVPGEMYNPATFWPQIEADKEAGLLANFGINEGMAIRIEKVSS